MSYRCFKCIMLCEFIGVAFLATKIVDDPEGGVALSAMKEIYAGFTKQYGASMTERRFIENTKNLLGSLSDLAFIAQYPKKLCKWFANC